LVGQQAETPEDGMSQQKSVKDLLIEELKDIYDAEHRLTKALPKLAKMATSEELSSAFEHHLKQTEGHITRLEEVFQALGETPKRKTCKAMVGLLEEGKEIMEEDALDNIKDLGLIAAAQKVEHYEMATYGCLRTWAEMLDEQKAVKLLQKTLDEEAAADEKLTQIAKLIKPEAVDEEDEESTMATAGSGRKRGPARATR
jgi:ferritin-like metal-binding protein YciE